MKRKKEEKEVQVAEEVYYHIPNIKELNVLDHNLLFT